MKAACLPLLFFLPAALAADTARFAPAHRLTGVGVGRDDLSLEELATRTDRMIAAQTFAIMREPQALPGARRITGNLKLQALFRSAALASGFPERVLEAIAYLESWGDPKAESPAGPRGIMQVSAATAATMGLKITYARRYRLARERVAVRTRRGRTTWRTVTRKIPYRALLRDERLLPERAIPAAARYLAGMEQKFGGRDWAIFAYHCGQGCIGMLQDVARHSHGIPAAQMTVAGVFFANNPAWNRDLFEALQQQMQRDYSPTYWFRVMRAAQLLDLYRRDPEEFTQLAAEYKSEFVAANARAPHRLSVWLKKEDLVYRSGEDIRAGLGNGLVRALDRPAWFGYTLQLDGDSASEASPAAVGTLIYVAFETRRLFDEMHPRGARFEPLAVTSLVQPEDSLRLKGRPEALTHCSGQVFDIDYSALPPAELECLRFVLSDLGWEGYLGFVEEGMDSLHIGSAPAARDFFTAVFQDAVSRSED
ncbi:MAG: transglycosylase SLT domain-containing protein [Acidobacteriota bacterium]|nr:transglycosylase SLT domain-containing protein [Acidobacteriota bacterium]